MKIMVDTGGPLPRSISDLAISAAVEVNNYRLGRSHGFVALDYVIGWLEESYRNNFPAENLNAYDPSFVGKIGIFLHQHWFKRRSKGIDDIRQKLRTLVESLQDFRRQLKAGPVAAEDIIKFRELLYNLSISGLAWRYAAQRRRSSAA